MSQSTLIMENNSQHLEQIAEIKAMMERSSRFISLSGLSGVFAGCIALISTFVVYTYVDFQWFLPDYLHGLHITETSSTDFILFIVSVGVLTLVLAFIGAFYFTHKKAQRDGISIWNSASKRLTLNIIIPMIAGGIFVFGLIHTGDFYLIAPSTLVFYGIALLNGSKYTVDDIRYLGMVEIALGLISIWFSGYGLLFWALGFGVLHIVYGIVMYMKYDKVKS